jgi:hypothetical protein
MPIVIEVFHSHTTSRNMCVTHSSILQWSSGWFTYALQVWRYSSALFFTVTMLTVIWVIHFGATSSNLQVSSSHFTIAMQMAIRVVHLQTACLLVPYSYIGITTLMAVRVLNNFFFQVEDTPQHIAVTMPTVTGVIHLPPTSLSMCVSTLPLHRRWSSEWSTYTPA